LGVEIRSFRVRVFVAIKYKTLGENNGEHRKKGRKKERKKESKRAKTRKKRA
jgi:hypothetical protein